MSGRHAHVVVQKLRCEVGPVRPDKRMEFRVNGEPFEVSWIPESFKHRTPKGLLQIDFARCSVPETKPYNEPANVPCIENVVIHFLLQGGDGCKRLPFARLSPILQQFLLV